MKKNEQKIWRPINTWGLVVISMFVVLAMAGSLVAIAP